MFRGQVGQIGVVMLRLRLSRAYPRLSIVLMAAGIGSGMVFEGVSRSILVSMGRMTGGLAL